MFEIAVYSRPAPSRQATTRVIVGSRYADMTGRGVNEKLLGRRSSRSRCPPRRGWVDRDESRQYNDLPPLICFVAAHPSPTDRNQAGAGCREGVGQHLRAKRQLNAFASQRARDQAQDAFQRIFERYSAGGKSKSWRDRIRVGLTGILDSIGVRTVTGAGNARIRMACNATAPGCGELAILPTTPSQISAPPWSSRCRTVAAT